MHAGVNPSESDRSAEQLVQAEAATRLRDRGFFEGQNRLERDRDLSVAAPLNSTVGPHFRSGFHPAALTIEPDVLYWVREMRPVVLLVRMRISGRICRAISLT